MFVQFSLYQVTGLNFIEVEIISVNLIRRGSGLEPFARNKIV
jgi:hypothetical protein